VSPEQLKRRCAYAYVKGWECGAGGRLSDAELFASDVISDYARGCREGAAARLTVRRDKGLEQ